MKFILIITSAVGFGYLIGNFYPLIDLLKPEQTIIFETDFVIKAGTEGKTRYFKSSVWPLPVELNFGDAESEFPKIKLISKPIR